MKEGGSKDGMGGRRREAQTEKKNQSWQESERLNALCLSLTQRTTEKEKEGGSREDEEGGWKDTMGEKRKEGKNGGLSWFLVTQRAAEGLTGTNSLWCNANSFIR